MTPAPLIPWDSFDSTFIAATNNVATRVFRIGGATGRIVATMTFTYLAAGASNDDTVKSVVTSYPQTP